MVLVLLTPFVAVTVCGRWQSRSTMCRWCRTGWSCRRHRPRTREAREVRPSGRRSPDRRRSARYRDAARWSRCRRCSRRSCRCPGSRRTRRRPKGQGRGAERRCGGVDPDDREMLGVADVVDAGERVSVAVAGRDPRAGVLGRRPAIVVRLPKVPQCPPMVAASRTRIEDASPDWWRSRLGVRGAC